jgi:hypothetical protein
MEKGRSSDGKGSVRQYYDAVRGHIWHIPSSKSWENMMGDVGQGIYDKMVIEEKREQLTGRIRIDSV